VQDGGSATNIADNNQTPQNRRTPTGKGNSKRHFSTKLVLTASRHVFAALPAFVRVPIRFSGKKNLVFGNDRLISVTHLLPLIHHSRSVSILANKQARLRLQNPSDHSISTACISISTIRQRNKTNSLFFSRISLAF
jgi:hypothetical protein